MITYKSINLVFVIIERQRSMICPRNNNKYSKVNVNWQSLQLISNLLKYASDKFVIICVELQIGQIEPRFIVIFIVLFDFLYEFVRFVVLRE